MDGIRQLIENIKARLGELSFNQKVLLGAVATASVISVAVFSLWLQKEESAVLFTNMSPEDASVALAELAKQDVEAELTNGGTTILVPENMVHRLRVDLAAKGVPSTGTVGFEIFDGKQYGLTEFLQNVNFKRALEGELTKSIESLQGIQSARVHLVLPKQSMFKKMASDATASVVLRLGRNANLADSQINGIQSLVSGSVENLDQENVVVLDQNGRVMSSSSQNDDIGQAETQLAMRQSFENYLAEKATSMLDGVLGPNKSIVRVDAELNFEKINTERETFDPATVVRSETRGETNDPSNGGTDENSVTNYEINRTVEHIVGETGGVKSLSVAVFVDGHYEVGEDGGTPVYQPLTEDEMSNLRRIVQTSVGISAIRGDQIEVVNMQFMQQDPESIGGGTAPDWIGIVSQNIGKVVMLIIMLVVVLSLKKNLGQLLTDAFKPIGSIGATSGASGSDTTEIPDHFDGIPEMTDKMVDDIQEYASENPERVAEVIQSWIQEINLGGNQRQAAGE